MPTDTAMYWIWKDIAQCKKGKNAFDVIDCLLTALLTAILKPSCSDKEKKSEGQLVNKCTSYPPLRQSATLSCSNYNLQHLIICTVHTGFFNYQMTDSFKSCQ